MYSYLENDDLVHVISGLEAYPSRRMDRELFENEIRKEAGQMVERLQKSAGIGAPMCMPVGNVAESVREEAHRHGADLVVIGRGAIHETLGRLRTHAYGIIGQSPCPVLSV
jgi:nucleotide-binding universal stress UspA family protein